MRKGKPKRPSIIKKRIAPIRNERKTENLVRKRLGKHGFYKARDIIVEEQKSDSPRIRKLLQMASKKGGGPGFPEFIITSSNAPDFIIVVECKADPKKHVSGTLAKPVEFAVDGALLYASYLSRESDVLAIAVSGEVESEIRISHYVHLKGSAQAVEFPSSEIQSFSTYYDQILHSDIKFRQDYDSLLQYSRNLNEELQAKKVKEAHRGLLICGILIALSNPAFKKSYKFQKTARHLAGNLVTTIVNEFKSANLPHDRIESLEAAFAFIRQNATLTKDKEFFVSLIDQIDSHVNAFVRTHKYHDALGQFYVQFLRYANNDKGLGIVLTPPHICQLFVELAEVNKKSMVYDNCCGTSGFLIPAMRKMLSESGLDEKTQNSIKNKQLIGVEFQDDIYALAVSNMVIHGDGKTNILPGSCFDLCKVIAEKYKPNVGLLNPPYKTIASTPEELDFVLDNLSTLREGGRCVAIVPLSCAIGDDSVTLDRKRKVMEQHTLEAVMSMPPDLFHDSDVGVITCIMVMTAHRPHPKGKKTWFGYWRDDGFVLTKHIGRTDVNGAWSTTMEKWLRAYRSREVIDGLSVIHEVGSEDEWCAEAYMKTDYSTITQGDFEEAVRDYAVFRLVGIQRDK